MKPDDTARHGSALLEQVGEHVDAPRGLERLRRGERNTRGVAVALAAAAVLIFVLFGGLWWLSHRFPRALLDFLSRCAVTAHAEHSLAQCQSKAQG